MAKNMKLDLSEQTRQGMRSFPKSEPLSRSKQVQNVQSMPNRNLPEGKYTLPAGYTTRAKAVPFPGYKDC